MIFRNIYRHVIQRRLPYGLFSWRFLLPNQSAAIRFHRSLIMLHYPQIPRFIFFWIALFVGIRWVLFYSFYYSFRVVIHKGGVIQKKTGQTLWQQYWQVLRISMEYGLSPIDCYQFQLYQTNDIKNVWNHIYDQEAAAFHHYRNQQFPKYKEHASLLGDKWKFEEYLQTHNIAAANTLTLISKGDANTLERLQALTQQNGRLFCKRRTGNQGKGAFSVSSKGPQLEIQPRGMGLLPEAEIENFLRGNMQKYDYLVQIDFKHHQQFKIAQDDQTRPAVALRVITRIESQNVYIELATLYKPIIDEKNNLLLQYPIAINHNTGVLDKVHSAWPHDYLSKIEIEKLKYFIKTLSGDQMPFWDQVLKISYKSHLLFASIDQIAWDFILAEERAILLEGNSGWGDLAICQRFGYDVARYMPEKLPT